MFLPCISSWNQVVYDLMNSVFSSVTNHLQIQIKERNCNLYTLRHLLLTKFNSGPFSNNVDIIAEEQVHINIQWPRFNKKCYALGLHSFEHICSYGIPLFYFFYNGASFITLNLDCFSICCFYFRFQFSGPVV